MIIYKNTSTDPYFNLAAEEYLLENAEDDVFSLWQNDRAVIIGKNQNAFAEIDQQYLERNGIALVRRLTGGGAVYHDLGNICFTFISNSVGRLDFRRFLAPVVETLCTLGFPAEISGRNDIEVEGAKVSGSAQCVRRSSRSGEERVLHHGTLLFDADLSALSGALNVNPIKLRAKGISSVRSRVENLRVIADRHGICPGMNSARFFDYLERDAARRFGEAPREYTSVQRDEILCLVREKYGRWEYNYGESHAYSTVRGKYLPCGFVEVSLEADGGVICACAVRGDFFGTGNTTDLEKLLLGCRLSPEAVRERILTLPHGIGYYISGATEAELLQIIFE